MIGKGEGGAEEILTRGGRLRSDIEIGGRPRPYRLGEFKVGGGVFGGFCWERM